MKTIIEHIEHVKGKPHHIRKRVAFGITVGVTTLIAFVWLAGSLATGAFAIGESSRGEQPAVTTSGTATTNGLAGAVAALPDVTTDAPVRIEIIDAASSAPVKKAEQTILPF